MGGDAVPVAEQRDPAPAAMIEFVCRYPGVAKNFPIRPASEFIPQWFRDLPAHADVDGWQHQLRTVKMCPGVQDRLLSGFIIPTWCDMFFNITEDGQVAWEVPADMPGLEGHPQWQAQGMPLPPFAQTWPIKFSNMWACRVPRGFMVKVGNVPLAASPFHMVEAITGHDTYHQLNPVGFLIAKEPGERIIPAGTPFVHLQLIREDDLRPTFSVEGSPDRYMELAQYGGGGGGEFGKRLVPGAYRAQRLKQGCPVHEEIE